jgi:hypothetical protein
VISQGTKRPDVSRAARRDSIGIAAESIVRGDGMSNIDSLGAGEKIAELLRGMPYYSARAALKVADALVEEAISADGRQVYAGLSLSPA